MRKSAIALGVVLLLASACKGDRAEDSQRATSPGSAGSAGSAIANVEQALAQIVATCAETVGTTEIRRQGQARWEPVAVGTTFRERDWVRTGPHSFARLRFGTRGFLDIGESSTVLVDTSLTVQSGVVVGVAEGDQPIVVNAADGTQASIAAGPGGPVEFRLTPSEADGVEIAVTKGSLKVTTKDGERVVAAGEATDLAHQRAGDVVKLLDFPRSLFPGVDARFQFAAKMSIPLRWAKVPGAAHYYVQLARDTEFHNLILTAETATPDTTFTPDREGVYAWRVAGRDAKGRLGEFGFARRIYCESDQPRDLLIGPRDGFTVEFPKTPPPVEFSWRAMGEATKYKLVVDKGAPGGEVVATTTTAAQHASVSLSEGTYSWGVYTVAGDREEPIFLQMRQLVIHRQLGPKIRTEVLWNQPPK